jgi:hypothetical protein
VIDAASRFGAHLESFRRLGLWDGNDVLSIHLAAEAAQGCSMTDTAVKERVTTTAAAVLADSAVDANLVVMDWHCTC